MTFDFTAAFDTLDRNQIIRELSRLGVHHQNLCWIANFLKDRKDTLVYGNQRRQITFQKGVPQGSIIGPLAFIGTTDALRSTCESVLLLKYADDTAVAAAISNEGDLMKYKEAVCAVSSFAEKSGLLLNPSKTQELVIDFRRSRLTPDNLTRPIEIDGKEIQRSEEISYLGVTLARHLKWDLQVNKMTQSLKKAFYALKLLKTAGASKAHLLNAYNCFFRPRAEYASIIWGPNLSKTLSDQLERNNQTAHRICHGWQCACTDWETLSQRRQKQLACIAKLTTYCGVPKARTERYRKSTIPTIQRILREKYRRR